MLLKIKRHFLSVIFFSLLLSFFVFVPAVVFAALGPSSVKLYGAAWSSNIGWISFNNCELDSEGGETCQGPNYSVSVNESTGAMTGAAWSSNIGWIKFGGLSQFPVGDGTLSANATVAFSGGSPQGLVTGWARACAGTIGGDCSSMSSQTDGWDGWISLSGANHPSPTPDGSLGVTFVNNRLVGKAWGGDVIGWINFVDVRYGVAPEPEPLDYKLTNISPNFELQIPRGNIGNISVQRIYLKGEAEQISISAAPILPPTGSISISIETDNPCLIPPDCSSLLRIYVSGSVPLGDYSFVVTGVSNLSGVERETTIRFRVVDESAAPPPKVTCEATGELWIFGTVTWVAEIAEGEALGGELFSWGPPGSTCKGQPSEECQTMEKTYFSPGLKLAYVKVSNSDGALGEAVCDAPVGVKVFFKEI